MSAKRVARHVVAPALAVGLLWSADAVGQSRGLEGAAQEAFDEGMLAMKQGDYARACPLLEESLKYDPGMAAKFRLAECYERLGLLATAWEHYLQVSEEARAAGMRKRADFARERAEAIAPRLPSLVIDIPEEYKLDVDFEVRCDGEIVPRPFWGAPMPVDPGPHRIVVSAPGWGRWVRSARILEQGATRTIAFPGFKAGSPDEAAPDETAGGTPAQLIAGVVLGGLGAGLLGAGLGVGIAARNRYDDAEPHCIEQRCDDVGVAIRTGALDQARVATVLFVIGASSLVGGGVLWLTTPDDELPDDEQAEENERDVASTAKARVGVTPAGLVLGGTW